MKAVKRVDSFNVCQEAFLLVRENLNFYYNSKYRTKAYFWLHPEVIQYFMSKFIQSDPKDAE